MVKLLLCILCALCICGAMLYLRQQKLEINYQTNQMHRHMQTLQTELWNQQLQVAIFTSPNAIEHTVNAQKMQLVPAKPLNPSMVNAHGDDGE